MVGIWWEHVALGEMDSGVPYVGTNLEGIQSFLANLWNFLSWIPESEEGPWHKSSSLQEIQSETLGQRNKA